MDFDSGVEGKFNSTLNFRDKLPTVVIACAYSDAL